MLARSCCSYNIRVISPKMQLLHKIHKTAQMTGKQQKPTHYKITQIYTNTCITNKKNNCSLRRNTQYKIWQDFGNFHSFGTVWDGCMLGW